MKKLLLVFTLFCFHVARSVATTYHPFPASNGSWNYRYYDEMHIPTQAFTSIVLAGDTSISGTNYKKILKNYSYAGALREGNKIIYFIPDTSSQEYVLYDFNLSAGDTVKNIFGPAICNNGTVTILYEDSILLQNGYHRRLNLTTNVQWVEGVGSFNYFLEPKLFYCTSGNDYLECIAENSGITYASSTSLCIVSVAEIKNSNYNYSISPNPFKDFITVQSNSSLQSEHYQLFDNLGRILITNKFDATNTIDLSLLSIGIYFLRLNEQNFKLVKQ